LKLDKNISDLLYQYDCVIVPELGGFVSNYHPASLDGNSSIFSPPRKAISFNSYLKNNDGLLAKYIAEKESLSFEEVNEQLKRTVEEYFTKLNNGDRVVFDKVGILYMDKSKKIQFSPELANNYLLESFGLRRVYAHADQKVKTVVKEPIRIIKKEQPVKVENIVVPIAPPTEVVELKTKDAPIEELDDDMKRRIWRSAAVIIPFALLMGYFLKDPSEGSNQHLSNLNPFKDSIAHTYQKRSEVFNVPVTKMESDFPDLFELPEDKKTIYFSLTDNEEDKIPVSLIEKTKTLPRVSEKVASTALNIEKYMAPTAIKSRKYHVIAGCFGEQKNAQKKVRRIRKKGFDAFIIDKRKGLYRVVYGSFSTKNDALVMLQAVKQNEDRSAWLLKK
jgi:hypothetical protein